MHSLESYFPVTFKQRSRCEFRLEIRFISGGTRAAGQDVGTDVGAAKEEPGKYLHVWNMLHW